MKENQKSLISINENSIFYKIKVFFKNLFKRNIKVNTVQTESIDNNKVEVNLNTKDSFIENIRNIENEETRLLKLQKQYDNEEIQEKDLTDEQIIELQKLYAKQISDLEASNENRKARLREYRKKLQTSY